MNWLVWGIPLSVVVFLWSLNECLRGRMKELIAGVLTLLIFGLCGVAFIVSGWLWGVVALAAAFAVGALCRYGPAVFVARRLIEYPDLGAEEYARRRLDKTIRDFGSDKYFRRVERKERKEGRHMAKAIARALTVSDVQEVLHRRELSRQDLEAFYKRIEISSLPPWLREAAICNARMLDFFFENSVVGEFAGEYLRNVQDRDVSIRLTLWAAHNPSEDMPT